MKIKQESMKIQELLVLKKQFNALRVNSEYQRGEVWELDQKKKLIDSILRGYPLPVIYLHDESCPYKGATIPIFYIIDGQQRINAIFEFSVDGFPLFDPKKDEKKAKFLEFIKTSPCTWARKKYSDLSQDDKEKFDNAEITIVKIITDITNETRDLFIRLQAGLPLTPQEKRDALPGGYKEFVLRFGGKPQSDDPKHSGHGFFRKTLKFNKKEDKRGKARLYCAQFAMLFFEHIKHGNYIDVGTKAIDDYYYKNLDFDFKSDKVKYFEKALDKLEELFTGYKGKRIKQQEAMHLVLFVHTLITEYVQGWEQKFILAFDQFRKEVFLAKKEPTNEYWQNFGMKTRVSAASADSVQTRHEFFSKKMLDYLNPTKKDSKRTINQDERQIIYYKYNKICAVCFETIDWEDLDVHHVVEHYQGGETSLENSAPVHRECHPKNAEKTKQFADNWEATKKKLSEY